MPIAQLTHLIAHLLAGARSTQRGLSQSTENAILLAGAATIAMIIVSAITVYVTDNLPG